MRTPTGEYRIDYFNKYGERIQGWSKLASSLSMAHRAAAESAPAESTSYTLHRCVFNSLDQDVKS